MYFAKKCKIVAIRENLCLFMDCHEFATFNKTAKFRNEGIFPPQWRGLLIPQANRHCEQLDSAFLQNLMRGNLSLRITKTRFFDEN